MVVAAQTGSERKLDSGGLGRRAYRLLRCNGSIGRYRNVGGLLTQGYDYNYSGATSATAPS